MNRGDTGLASGPPVVWMALDGCDKWQALLKNETESLLHNTMYDNCGGTDETSKVSEVNASLAVWGLLWLFFSFDVYCLSMIMPSSNTRLFSPYFSNRNSNSLIACTLVFYIHL